jgi:hypothetical protein
MRKRKMRCTRHPVSEGGLGYEDLYERGCYADWRIT